MKGFMANKHNEVRIVASGTKVNGKLQRDEEWLGHRIELLRAKVADYQNRTKNALQEIKDRQKELETLKKGNNG